MVVGYPHVSSQTYSISASTSSSSRSSSVAGLASRQPNGLINRTSSFPILTSNDRQIIDQIITRAPPASTLFNALLDHYRAVLDQHAIEHRLDDRYYSLILKLSLVDGKDWAEKWQRVCLEQGLVSKTNSPAPLNLPPVPEISRSQSSESTEEDGSRTIVARPPPLHPFSPPHTPNLIARNSPRTVYRARSNTTRPPIQSTPNGKSVRFTPSKKKRMPWLDSDKDSEVEQPITSSSKFVDPLELLSDRFRRDHLLKTWLRVWNNRSRIWTSAQKAVIHERELIVAARVWSRWRSQLGKRSRQLAMVKGVAQNRLKLATLARWKRATVDSQRTRWKRQLINMALEVIERKKEREILDLFINWILKTRLSIKLKARDDLLRHSTLSSWCTQLSKLNRAKNLAQQYCQKITIVNESRTLLVTWRSKADLKVREKKFVQRFENRLTVGFLRSWLYVGTSERLARTYSENSRRRYFFRLWRRRRQKLKRLERRANKIILLRDQNLLYQNVKIWMIAEREQLLGRTVLARLLRRSLSEWQKKLDRIRFYLNAGQQVFQKKTSKRGLIKTLKQWKFKSEEYSKLLPTRADQEYRSNLILTKFIRWKIIYTNIKERLIKCENDRFRSILEKVFEIWLKKFQRIKILKFVKRVRQASMEKALHEWVYLVKRKQQDRGLLSTFNKAVTPTRMSIYLKVWVQKIVNLRETQIEVQKVYEVNLVSLYLQAWVSRIREIARLDDLAIGFSSVQKIERRDRILGFWRSKASKIKKRREIFDRFQIDLQNRLLRFIWDRWMDSVIEKRLRLQEYMIRDSYNERLKLQSIQIWSNKTDSLSSIRFDRQRLRITCFDHWISLVPIRRLRRQAALRDREQVLREAFKVWWNKCTAIRASRIFSRFSRPSSFSSGKRRIRNELVSVQPRRNSQSNQNGLSASAQVITNGHWSVTRNSSQTTNEEMNGMSTSESEGSDQLGEPERSIELDKIDESRGEEEEQEEEEETAEDQTVIGDISEMVEEPSTDGTEGHTESEIEAALLNRFGRRRLGFGIRNQSNSQPNGIITNPNHQHSSHP